MEEGIALVLKKLIQAECRKPVADKVDVSKARCSSDDNCIALDTLPANAQTMVRSFQKYREQEKGVKQFWTQKVKKYRDQQRKVEQGGRQLLGGRHKRRILVGNNRPAVLSYRESYKPTAIPVKTLDEQLVQAVREVLHIHHADIVGRPFAGLAVFSEVLSTKDLLMLSTIVRTKLEGLESNGSLLRKETKWGLKRV